MELETTLTIQKDICIGGSRVGDYTFNEKEDTLYYELPYLFPCKMSVKSLKHITVTPMMLRLPSFLTYHNVSQLRQQLLQIQCIHQDALLIHGSAWKKDEIGVLAVGFPNSGKTTSVLTAVSEGAIFCSDENVIIANRRAFPVVRKTALSRWLAQRVNYPLSTQEQIRMILAEIRSMFLPIFEPMIWVDLPYEREAILIDQILYLTDGKNRSLQILTDNEFPFFTNPVIQTYAYATGWNLQGTYDRYRELMAGFVGGIK